MAYELSEIALNQFKEWVENRPVIRLSKIKIENLKGVKFGEIDLKHGKNAFTPSEDSDILGLYGQNGSGKSTIIDALRIFQQLALHKSICGYGEYIAGDEAVLTYTFEYILDDKVDKIVEYCLHLCREYENEDYIEYFGYSGESREEWNEKIGMCWAKIKSETISASGKFDGKKIKMQPIISINSDNHTFGPASKKKFFYDQEIGLNEDYFESVYQGFTNDRKSFLLRAFDAILLLKTEHVVNDYVSAIITLSFFGCVNMNVELNDGLNEIIQIDADEYMYGLRIGKSSSNNILFDVYGNYTPNVLPADDGMIKDEDQIVAVEDVQERYAPIIEGINIVLAEMFDDLKLEITWFEDQYGVFREKLYIIRNEEVIDYQTESRGIKRLIQEIYALIKAYNDPREVLAIDEFDSGIFEFLLGEILEIFEESGKGQLIFTSHNLRPLEVLNKRCICFTTTNPENRYYRMKGVGHTYNLRNMYFREILMNEQDEELYSAAKKHKLAAAFRQAGKVGETNGEEA